MNEQTIDDGYKFWCSIIFFDESVDWVARIPQPQQLNLPITTYVHAMRTELWLHWENKKVKNSFLLSREL